MYVDDVRRLKMVIDKYRTLTRICVQVVVRLFVGSSLSEQLAGSIRAYIHWCYKSRYVAEELLSSWIIVFLDH